MRQRNPPSSVASAPLASMELGTYTARLLIAVPTGDRSLFRPLARERRTVRLAEGFGNRGTARIGEAAADRAAAAVGFFEDRMREEQGTLVRAVATGVVRSAKNRDAFLRGLLDRTGVAFEPVSGEVEAKLTAKGALYALPRPDRPFVLFDLGGGSTEFVRGGGLHDEPLEVCSLPLGAAVLTEAFLREDPPSRDALRRLADAVDEVLETGFDEPNRAEGPPLLIGTGGTATTLAAMIHGIDLSRITPERMNGLVLDGTVLEALLDRMVRLRTEERKQLRGLDPERAEVIPAGTQAVLRIMARYGTRQVTVCLSDILDGLLIEELEETHE